MYSKVTSIAYITFMLFSSALGYQDWEVVPHGNILCGPGSYYLKDQHDGISPITRVFNDIDSLNSAKDKINELSGESQYYNRIIMWQLVDGNKLVVHYRSFLHQNLDSDTGKSLETLDQWTMIQYCTRKAHESDIYYRPDDLMPSYYVSGFYENHDYDQEGKNDWHYVQITADDEVKDDLTYKWNNADGAKWTLTMAYSNADLILFSVGKDCPYYSKGYVIALLYKDSEGNTYITGPWGEKYYLESGVSMPNDWESTFDKAVTATLPTFYATGFFENHDYDKKGKNDWHYVQIAADDKANDDLTYKWNNAAGVEWTLTIDIMKSNSNSIVFNVGKDCPYYAKGYVTAVLSTEDDDKLYITGPGNEKYYFESGMTKPEGWGQSNNLR